MQCLDIIHLKAFDSFFSDIRIPYPMWTLPLGRTEVHKILPWQSPPAVTNTLPGNITIIILASFRSLLFGYMFLMHLRIKKKIPWLYRKNRLRMWKRKTLLFWNQNSIIICSKLIETLKVTFLRLIQYMNLCNTIRKLLELPFTTFLKVFHVIFEKKIQMLIQNPSPNNFYSKFFPSEWNPTFPYWIVTANIYWDLLSVSTVLHILIFWKILCGGKIITVHYTEGTSKYKKVE